MGMVKVQPDEGCDNKEEVDRKRGLLKLMTPQKMLIVESEVQICGSPTVIRNHLQCNNCFQQSLLNMSG